MKKCSEPFCGFTPFNLGSWCILGLLQNGYLEIDHAKRLWIFQSAQGPSSQFLSTNWVLDNG